MEKSPNASIEGQTKDSSLYLVDILKWVFSVCVVAIHTQLVGRKWEELFDLKPSVGIRFWDNSFDLLCILAVPFFLMISAYLIMLRFDWNKDCENNFKVLSNSCRKMFKLYFVWSLIYIIPTFLVFLVLGCSVPKSTLLLIVSIAIGGIGGSTHLWYVLAMALILLFMTFVIGKRSSLLWIPTVLSVIFFALFVYLRLGPFYSTEDVIKDLVQDNLLNILKSMILFCLGTLTARDKCLKKGFVYAPTWLKGLLFFMSFFGVVTFCVVTDYKLSDVFFASTLCGYLLFMWVISIDFKGPSGINIIFRNLSTYVYFTHIWVYFVEKIFIRKNHYVLDFVLVTIGSNLVAACILFFKKRKKEKAS